MVLTSKVLHNPWEIRPSLSSKITNTPERKRYKSVIYHAILFNYALHLDDYLVDECRVREFGWFSMTQ